MKIIDIKKGDTVTRMLGGEIPMNLIVSNITDTEIICGDWKFSRLTGGEIDYELGWDGINTGSYLVCERY